MKNAIALALAACTLGSAAIQPAEQRYQIEAEVRDGATAPKRPRLTVVAGQPATIQMADRKRSLRVTATPDANGKVAVSSFVTSWTPDGLAHQNEQAEIKADGALLQMSFPGTHPATAELAVDIKVTPVTQ
jgi:hypothetical protein